jgi:hypothetical protein
MDSPSRTARAILSTDTSRDAEDVQLRAWRSMPSADKIRQILGLCRAARHLAVAGLRARHPDASDAELMVRLASFTLGPRLARLVYPDTPMNLEPPYGDDLIGVTLAVTAALERRGVPYTVGGSLASSFSGEPRSSIDADIVIDMSVDQVEQFLDALGTDYYADADAPRRAIRTGPSTNLVHRPTGIKVDLFAASSLLDRQQLARRRRVQVVPDRFIFVHSPEDILLQKLHWYRAGYGVSERQWRDALSIILVQREALDREYLATMAARLELQDLLDHAYRETDSGE